MIFEAHPESLFMGNYDSGPHFAEASRGKQAGMTTHVVLMTKYMKILITGGAGFLGLHLAKFLKKKRWNITLFDIAAFDKKEYPNKCIFIEGDIRNKRLIDKATKDMDVVIHAAAALPLWRAKEIFEINVVGTRNLLQASLKNNVRR